MTWTQNCSNPTLVMVRVVYFIIGSILLLSFFGLQTASASRAEFLWQILRLFKSHPKTFELFSDSAHSASPAFRLQMYTSERVSTFAQADRSFSLWVGANPQRLPNAGFTGDRLSFDFLARLRIDELEALAQRIAKYEDIMVNQRRIVTHQHLSHAEELREIAEREKAFSDYYFSFVAISDFTERPILFLAEAPRNSARSFLARGRMHSHSLVRYGDRQMTFVEMVDHRIMPKQLLDLLKRRPLLYRYWEDLNQFAKWQHVHYKNQGIEYWVGQSQDYHLIFTPNGTLRVGWDFVQQTNLARANGSVVELFQKARERTQYLLHNHRFKPEIEAIDWRSGDAGSRPHRHHAFETTELQIHDDETWIFLAVLDDLLRSSSTAR